VHLPVGLGAAVGGLRVAAGLDLDLIRATADGIAGPRFACGCGSPVTGAG
jgi:hypothetical protein